MLATLWASASRRAAVPRRDSSLCITNYAVPSCDALAIPYITFVTSHSFRGLQSSRRRVLCALVCLRFYPIPSVLQTQQFCRIPFSVPSLPRTISSITYSTHWLHSAAFKMPSISRLLGATSLLAATAAAQTYGLQKLYSGSTFFNSWTFFTADDPNQSFVE